MDEFGYQLIADLSDGSNGHAVRGVSHRSRWEPKAASVAWIMAASVPLCWQQVAVLYGEDRYWPEPLIQINPSYRRVTTVERLVVAGQLEPGCAALFRTGPAPQGESLTLFKHQE